MRVEHTLTVVGRCPVNDCPDVYTVTVRTPRVVFVETILETVADLTRWPLTQEELTQKLAARLGCEVETAGSHSGVMTRVVCGGADECECSCPAPVPPSGGSPPCPATATASACS